MSDTPSSPTPAPTPGTTPAEPSSAPQAPALQIPANVLTQEQYNTLYKSKTAVPAAGSGVTPVKLTRLHNIALNRGGSVSLITFSDRSVVAVVKFREITQEILTEVAPLLAKAVQMANPGQPS